MARALAADGDPAGAARAFQAHLELFPQDFKAWPTTIGLLLEGAEHEKAAAFCRHHLGPGVLEPTSAAAGSPKARNNRARTATCRLKA